VKVLKKSFYMRSTTSVALDLLGKKLVRVYKGKRIAGIITEVEAYLGAADRACHTFGHRRTKRTEMMYAEGGCAYIYLIYGMYNCFNVVTEKEGVPEAVLIRSLEPVEGIEQMRKFRGKSKLTDLCTGPGKLGEALHLTRDLNGQSLNSDILFIEDAPKIKSSKIVKTSRIGVHYAGEHAEWPLRFYIRDSGHVSQRVRE
jgi:DNA-3-methyladenine glycosylase